MQDKIDDMFLTIQNNFIKENTSDNKINDSKLILKDVLNKIKSGNLVDEIINSQ